MQDLLSEVSCQQPVGTILTSAFSASREVAGLMRTIIEVRADVAIQRELSAAASELVERLPAGGKVVQTAPRGHQLIVEMDVFVPVVEPASASAPGDPR